MKNETLYSQRVENLKKAVNRDNPAYVPVMGNVGGAALSYAGKRLTDLYDKPQEYHEAMMKVYEDVYFDVLSSLGIYGAYPNVKETFGENVQNFISPDGVSVVHVQRSPMQDNEYPQAIEDINKYVIETLMPRKYPQLFTDNIEKVVSDIKVLYDGQMTIFAFLNGPLTDMVKERFGIPVFEYEYLNHPLDILFDDFRGFTGTIADLRRHKSEVKELCDILYRVRCNDFAKMNYAYPYVTQMPHMPAYLNVKQFEEFYWPYYKEMIENIAKGGNKLYALTEGRWLHVVDFLRDLPKDSMIMNLDDDDVFEMHKLVGEKQIIAGGAQVSKLRLSGKEENIEWTKKVLDECAGDGGFIFTTDKYLVCEGDINENLAAINNYVHENGKY